MASFLETGNPPFSASESARATPVTRVNKSVYNICVNMSNPHEFMFIFLVDFLQVCI